jgi:hypothetical protein
MVSTTDLSPLHPEHFRMYHFSHSVASGSSFPWDKAAQPETDNAPLLQCMVLKKIDGQLSITFNSSFNTTFCTNG